MWFKKHGVERTWHFIEELVCEHKYKPRYEPDTFTYSLEELRLAKKCFNYIVHDTKRPENVPENVILAKNIELQYFFTPHFEYYLILVWILRHGGDTSLIQKNDTVATYSAQNPIKSG